MRLVGIALVSTAAAAAIAPFASHRSTLQGWSLGTAYVAFVLLAVSLSIGPLNVLRGYHNPVHNALRRDVGISAGIAALIHTGLGLQVHAGGVLARYFTLPEPRTPSGAAFVSTNYLGLVSAGILALIVGLSNNISIGTMGLHRWKRAQRLTYVAAGAAIVHGLLYQALEKRSIWLILFVAVASVAVLVLQLAGARAAR